MKIDETLVTNVLRPTALSRKQAADFYRRRWGVETAYRAVKQTLARRKLLSRSADLAERELAGIVLASWMLALLSLTSRGRGAWSRAWSPAEALRILREALHWPRRRGRSLVRQLAVALLPEVRSRRGKTRQDWPHKKNDPRCGAPKVTVASATLVAKAQHVTPIAT
jgi:Transposase DDE domain